MNCPKCNAELPNDALFCTQCMDRLAVEQQKIKVEEAKAKAKGIVGKQLHSTVLLIVAICFSAMFLSLVGSMLTGGIAGFLVNLLPFIFMLLTVIGLWSGYASKEGADLNKILNRISIYDAYNSVMYVIYMVLVIIAGVILAVASFAGGELIAGLFSLLGGGSEEDVEAAAALGGIGAFLIVIVILAIVVTVISLMRSVYKNRRRFFVELGTATRSGYYKIAKAPVIGSYVIGGYHVLSVVPALLFILSKNTFMASILSNLGAFGSLLSGILDGMGVSMIISGIGNLIIGAYYILSAVWMKSTHENQCKANSDIITEEATLKRIENDTTTAIQNMEIQRKRKENDARMAAEREAQKVQEELKEQQMQMMQQMMLMMQQQKAADAPAPAASAPESHPSDGANES